MADTNLHPLSDVTLTDPLTAIAGAWAAAPTPALLLSASGELRWINAAGAALLPNLEEAVGRGDPLHAHVTLGADLWAAALQRCASGAGAAEIAVDGTSVTVTLLKVSDALGGIAGIFATITARHSYAGGDNEQALRRVIDAIDVPIAYLSPTLQLVYANRASAQHLGREPQELVGQHIEQAISPRVAAEVIPRLREALTGKVVSYERLASVKPDGLETERVRVTLVPHAVVGGAVRGLFAVVTNIDHDRRLREALAERERQLMLFTANVPEAIAYVNSERRYVFVNETFARYRGQARANIVGRTVHEVLDDVPSRFTDGLIDRVRLGEVASYERLVKLADGSERWIRVRITPDLDASGAYIGHYVVGSDVHELKVAQEKLVAQEASLRLFMDSLPESIAFVDETWHYTYVNHNFARTRGKPGQAIVGLTPIELLGESLGSYLQSQLPTLMRGQSVVFERHASFLGESARWIRTSLVPNIVDGAYRGYYVVSTDIDDLKLAQQTLAESERVVRQFINKLPVAVGFVDADGRYQVVNHRFCSYSGKSEAELIGADPLHAIAPAHHEQVRAMQARVRAGERVSYDRLVTQPAGDARWIEVTLVPEFDGDEYRGHYAIAQDVHDARTAAAAIRQSEAELWQMIDSIPSPLAYVDAQMVYRYVNQAFLAWFALRRENVVGQSMLEILGAERYARGKAYFDRALAGEIVHADRSFTWPDGHSRWMQALYTPRIDKTLKVIGFYMITTDIHDKKLAEEALTRANWMLESHLQNTPLAAMEWDEQFRILRWSRQAERVFGWKESEVLGCAFTAINLIHEEDRDSFGHVVARLVSGASNKATSIQRMTNRAGEVLWCEWYHSVLRTADGRLVSVLSLSQDVSGRIQAEERLQRMATHDGLTGLPNRLLLQDRLTQAIARARRAAQKVVTLFIDLDHFKEVNDAYGHRVGDALLKEVTRRVRLCLRETDLLCRLSGDEFVVLMEGLVGREDSLPVARRILAEVRGINRIDSHAIKISASMGLSVYPDDADTPEGMLRNADLAMYRAKEQGKNTLETFSAEMEQTRQVRLDLEKDIAEAIANNELRLFYQPVVDIATGSVRSLEALIRWRRKDGTLVLPHRFVPMAEESGLIREIGPWTVRTAAAALARWHASGHDISVAINLAPRFFLGKEAVDTVLGALAEQNCNPARLTLEVTETGMLAHLDSVRDTLVALRQAGVRIALDDFGTGYSSLAYLRHLPVDSIKIDRTFVANLPDNKSDVAITSAIFALAKALDVDVVAEGVETQAQLEFLRGKGCDAYQGYLFSHPLPEDEIDALLRMLGTT